MHLMHAVHEALEGMTTLILFTRVARKTIVSRETYSTVPVEYLETN